MKLLSTWKIDSGQGAKRIELLEGDLTNLPPEHAVDILVVSAFKDNYAEVPGTLIGALARRGVSVGELATHKQLDLRDQFSCWLSQPLDPEHARLGFRCILCIEAGWTGEPPTITDNLFRALAPLLFTDIPISSVAMPLIGAGNQGYPEKTMLDAIVRSTVLWMRRGLPLKALKIVVLPRVSQDMAREFDLLRRNDDLAAARIATSTGGEPHEIVSADRARELNSLARGDTDGHAKASQGYDVFVSYSHKDATYAKIFSDRLRRHDKTLNIFVDASSIDEGASWPMSVATALDASRKVAVLHSEAYWTSKNCQLEFSAAFARQNDQPSSADGQILYPILLDDVKIPYMFRTPQYLDCRKFDEAKIALASRKLWELLSR